MEKTLVIKKSTIPGAGKGLFTKTEIPKGTRIIEYTGTVTTWKEVNHDDGKNPYIYYVSKDHVIDGATHPDALARYANDAKGLVTVAGVTNNCMYVKDGLQAYIHAKRNIAAGEEILVGYGKEYWDTIRYNKSLENDKNSYLAAL